MPVKPNFLERMAFYTLNAVPGTLLDLAGLFAYQAVATALILLFNVLHQFDLDAGTRLLKKAHRALKPGGKVAVLDQITGKISGSATNALIHLVALQYYLFIDGRVFAQDDLSHMANEADFTYIRFHSLQKLPGNSLMIAERT